MKSDPSPTREPTAIQNPEPPIGIPQPWPSVPTPKDQQLLPQVKVLHWVLIQPDAPVPIANRSGRPPADQSKCLRFALSGSDDALALASAVSSRPDLGD
jgi:hypothetical protein